MTNCVNKPKSWLFCRAGNLRFYHCAAACFQARAADLTAWRSVPGAGAGGEGGGGQSEGEDQTRGDCEGGWVRGQE